MVDQAQPKARADADMLADLHAIIVKYPPTNADRKHIHVRVEDGRVYLTGYVGTPIHRRYLHDAMLRVDGVRDIHVDHLWDDETIRLEVGRVLPEGIMGIAHHGTVVLTGHAPAGTDMAQLAAQVTRLPGVEKVVVDL